MLCAAPLHSRVPARRYDFIEFEAFRPVTNMPTTTPVRACAVHWNARLGVRPMPAAGSACCREIASELSQHPLQLP